MRCPFCDSQDSKVIDSRSSDNKNRRRRECINCHKRFTTYEAIEVPLLMVLKNDGSYEPFDKTKLIKGIFSAIKKRPVTMNQVEGIAEYIINHSANKMKNVISSKKIGDMTLEQLKKIDAISYIRFASVYKDFTDISSFVAIISELENNNSF